jgi:lipopolysaccharide heptosyltransferase I
MPEQAAERFVILKLGSLGDIVHTLPAVAALRDSFPDARMDWVADRRWLDLVQCVPLLDEVIALDRGSWSSLRQVIRRLREAPHACAIDFQGLYKSAILGFLSGVERRIGFGAGFAREPASAVFYTERVRPAGRHIVEQNLALAHAAGARETSCRFPLRVPAEAEIEVQRRLAHVGADRYFVLSPGGGWRSKCWPPERYGELCRQLTARYGWRGVLNFAPEERELGEAVQQGASSAEPVLLSTSVPELMALLRQAQLMVAGDSGPLHLAVALGAPVVGLYGPTDPARNGPFSPADVVVRNAVGEKTTHRRGRSYSRSMLSISVEQVLAAVEQRLARTPSGQVREQGRL